MFGRIATALLALTIALFVGAFLTGFRIELSEGQAALIGWRQGISDEEAMRRDVRWHANAEVLNTKIRAALDRNDIDDAAMYADIASWTEITVANDAQSKLAAAKSAPSMASQDLTGDVKAFVFSAPTSFSTAASAITSDTTIVGDVRDISNEGSKLLKGEAFDQIILGLSVVGVATTTTSVATEGGGAVIKSGVALLKFARRIGTLTGELSARVGQLIDAAVDFDKLETALKDVDLSDLAKTQSALTEYSKAVPAGPLFPILAKMDSMCTAAGIGECVRLVAYAKTPQDLDNLAAMAKGAGSRARGVIELTGASTATSFKQSVNVAQFISENVIAAGVWVAALTLIAFSSLFRSRREDRGGQRMPMRSTPPRKRRK